MKRISYYDSMGNTDWDKLEGIFCYLKDEHMTLYDTEMDGSGWQMVACPTDLPRQDNGTCHAYIKFYTHNEIYSLIETAFDFRLLLLGYDCGVFLCMYADFISNDYPIIFTQEEIETCRERIAVAIMRNMALG